MQLNCEHPKIILHPLAVERIVRFGNVTINGEFKQMPRRLRNLYHVNEKEISVYNNGITKDNLDSCYITDTATGEVYPLYLEVRCGKCPVCKETKVNAFVQRCELETMLYKCKPIFLTLTYNEENKPQDGVSVREVQLFLKRFRINLVRRGYRERIRYVFVGEYGKPEHLSRPHYHAILWNLHQNDVVQFREIRELLERSWSKGFIFSRLVDAGDNKTFYYTAKYLRKDCFVPDGCNPTFVCSSNRNGGIGAAYIDGLAGHILKTCDVTPKFRNEFSGQVKDLQLSSYVLNRIMPSLSSSIPSKVKNAMRTFNLCYSQMLIENDPNVHLFSENYEKYNDLFGRYLYCPRLSEREYKDFAVLLYTPHSLLRHALEADMVLSKWFDKGEEYFNRALYLNDRRAFYLCKLFEHVPEVTADLVALRGAKIRERWARSRQRLQI